MIPHLVPTLEKMVGEVIAQGFWDSHQKAQNELDAQCESELSYDDHRMAQMTARILGRAPVLRVSRVDLRKMYPKASL